MWFGVALTTDTKEHTFLKDRIACSNYKNHSKRNNQHNLGGMRETYMKIMRKVATPLIWVCANHLILIVFQTLGEVGHFTISKRRLFKTNPP